MRRKRCFFAHIYNIGRPRIGNRISEKSPKRNSVCARGGVGPANSILVLYFLKAKSFEKY